MITLRTILTIALISLWCRAQPLIAAEPAYRVSDNGRHLVRANGEPFFWQGDTEWDLFHLLTASEATELLRARKAHGFTVIQAMCVGIFPEWIARNKMPPWGDLHAWLDDNPLTPNEAYFRRMDEIVAAAQREGLLLVIGVYHAKDVEAKRITLENVRVWTRWLAARYRHAPNIVWSMYPHAEAASFPMVRAAVAGLNEGDGGSHLITLHPDPSPTSSSFMHTEAWLAFNTFQSWSSGYLNHRLAMADYARTPVKPVVNGEARYEEEDGTTALEVRRGAWWSYLAGAAYTYGHRDNWKSPRTWRDWVGTPGARQVEIAGRFLRSLAWWKLVPDQSLLVNEGECVAARSIKGDWVLVYLPTPITVTVKLDRVGSAKSKASWINPVTGEKTLTEVHPPFTRPTFKPPEGWQDAVLFIEN